MDRKEIVLISPIVLDALPHPLDNAPSSDGRGMEQLAARRAHNPKVAGSSPAPATK